MVDLWEYRWLLLQGTGMTLLLGFSGLILSLMIGLLGASAKIVRSMPNLPASIGQGITGVSTLALGSFIAFAAIVAGGVLGIRYQVWRLERQL